jgi:hypothetical protein
MSLFGEDYRIVVILICTLASASLALYFFLKSSKRPWIGLYAMGFLLISIGCALLFVDFLLGFTGVLASVRKGVTVILCLLGFGLSVLGEKRKRQIPRT